MRRPLIVVALGFMAGIIIAVYAALPLAAYAILSAVSAVLSILLFRFKRPRLRLAATLLLLAACGAAYYSARFSAHDLSVELTQQLISVRGIITDEPSVQQLPARSPRSMPMSSTSFSLDVSAAQANGDWLPTRGKLRAHVGEGSRQWQCGDEVIITGDFVPDRAARNPGERDMRQYWLRRGYLGSVNADSAGNVAIVGSSAWRAPIRLIFAGKDSMRNYLAANLPDFSARMLTCLLLGDRWALSADEQQKYVRTGTVHFLAVSGMNVALLAGSVWLILTILGLGARPTAAIVAVVTISYALLSGLQPPILRAAAMSIALCIGYWLERKPDGLNSLGLAALIVLVLDPSDIVNIGFQLSFASVAGIVLLNERIRNFIFGDRSLQERLTMPSERRLIRDSARSHIENALSISLAASAASLPLVAYSFNYISPLIPLYNLILGPFFWIIMVIGLPATVLGPVVGLAAWPFLTASDYLSRALDAVTEFLSHLPATPLYTRSPHLAWLLIYFALLLFLVARPRLKIRFAYAAGIALALANVFIWTQWIEPPRRPSITVLDVGDGCAAITETTGGHHVLYDAGSATISSVGEKIITPYLWERHISRLEAVIISHADSDHYNGVMAVIERFRVEQVILPTCMEHTPAGRELISEITLRGVPIKYLSRGDTLQLGETTIAAIHPPAPPSAFDRQVINETSLVIRLDDPAGSILLAGDAQTKALAALERQRELLRADILLAPHHGRKTEGIEQFLAAAAPRLVLISAKELPCAAYQQWPNIVTRDAGAITLPLPVAAP
jgi:competence protein ComEC